MKPSPPPYVPGNSDAERMDNAVRKMFSMSKKAILKHEAKEERERKQRRSSQRQQRRHQ